MCEIEDVLQDLQDQREKQFGFKSQCEQFLWNTCPDLEGSEFDDAMQTLEELAKIYKMEQET